MASLLLALIYLCFISLGLPDSLLGSAWPVLHNQLGIPVFYAGIVSAIISMGTILSSLFSDHFNRKMGAGLVTAVSITMTAVGLFGFSVSTRFYMLLLWAVPYGLGAGGVDAILNNYVALHYKPQHMSWLHCMWGVGASVSPYIMSFALIGLNSWHYGYLIVSAVQITLSIIVFMSIPLWKKGRDEQETEERPAKGLSFKEIVHSKGAVSCFLAFFFYCAMEVTSSLWTSTYLVEKWSFSPERAAAFASTFYIGITFGRFVNGFLAMKLSDKTLIRAGLAVVALGIVLLLIPLNSVFALAGFIIIGLGCAPVYPCIIHMTPSVFGKEKSQAMIGIQMAFAYSGFLLAPPIFGMIAQNLSIRLLPLFLCICLVCVWTLHERVVKEKSKH